MTLRFCKKHFLAMAAVMAMEALVAIFKTLIKIQVYNRKDISDHHWRFLQVGVSIAGNQ
jgi:hypothetical protein